MYDDHERGAVYAVSETVSVLRTTQSRWFLVVRREQRVQHDRPSARFCAEVRGVPVGADSVSGPPGDAHTPEGGVSNVDIDENNTL
jgi:hypothetical protein